MLERIWLSSPHMGGTEMQYINKAFEDNFIAPLGANVDGFEQDLCKYTQAKHAAVLSSGTAALHLALILAGVQRDDEVICQSFTFSASANPIVYQGAKPIFVDSELTTWNICPEMLEVAIKKRLSKGKKVKAIIPVHLYGMPANMSQIMEIALKYDIVVIEDAAEALGSTLHGKNAGTFGKFGILSFNGNKIITTSGGGALISDDSSLIEMARKLSTQARDIAPHYQHSQIGYNYRMSNVCAGIGRGQMEVIRERVEQRRKNYSLYKEQLSKISEIQFLDEPEGYYSNRWLSCVLLDTYEQRERIRLALEVENIESRPLWKPMHLQPVFAEADYFGRGVSDSLFERGLCLPSGSNLTLEQINRVIHVIKSLFA